MAEVDNRVKTLEDELRVIKGEVKRTLVDLRALLMREDSPLNEGGFSSRKPIGGQPDYDGGANLHSKSETAALGAVDAAKNGASSNPNRPADPNQQLPGLGPNGMVPPGYPGVQDKMMSNTLPGLGPNGMFANGAPNNPNLPPWAAGYDAARPRGGAGRRVDEADEAEETAVYRNGDYRRSESRERSRREEREGGRLERNGRGRDQREDRERDDRRPDGDRESVRRNGKGSRLYDEYQELLEGTEDAYQRSAASLQPDVNLLANLLHWASMARQRVGEARLKALVDLYLQVNQGAAAQRELLLQTVSLADDDAEPMNGGSQDIIDLLFHLHGILAGGLPPKTAPAPRRD